MLLGAAISPAAFAQVSLTTMGTAYTQTFDTLANSGAAQTWTDNTTIAGWYYTRSPTAATTYTPGTGSSNSGSLYSFGVAGAHAVTDRALGSVASSGNSYFYGVRLVNNTGATITSLTIQYTGEEWRTATTAPGKLQFQYQVGAAGTITSINAPSTGWTAYTALDFAGPNVTTGNIAVDGNAAGNRTALSSTLSVSIPAGQEVWLRWQDTDDAGSDAGLAIDDVSITPSNLPSISIADVNCPEGDNPVPVFPYCLFTVSINTPYTSDVGAHFQTSDGTAVLGTDYQPTNGDIDIPAGQTSTNFYIPVYGNTTPQPNRYFNVTLSSLVNALPGKLNSIATIIDDDGPLLSINDVTLAEGNSGTTAFTFTVSLDSPAVIDVTFNVATADGTATSASGDYAALASTPMTITAGNSSATVTVNVNGDTTPETDETFTVNVTNIAGARAAKTTGTGTILDDDTPSYSIMDIQGHGTTSPLAGPNGALGSPIKTPSSGHTNIVTAVGTKGFFMQDTIGDGDVTTSDGIFVFTGTNSNPAVTVGDIVSVSGKVQEFSGSTEIAGFVTFAVLGHDVSQVPAPFDLTAHPPTTDSNTGICMGPGTAIVPPSGTTRNDGYQGSNFACLDGMLVTISHGVINAPTPAAGGSGNTVGSGSNTGFLAVANTSTPRSFREPGLLQNDPNVAGNPNVPVFYGNPELIQVYYNGLVSLPSSGMPTAAGMSGGGVYNGGQEFSVTGVVQGFVASVTPPAVAADPTYEIYPRTAADLSLIGSPTYPVAVPDAIPNKLTVGSQNGLHFFNNTNDGQDTSQYADSCNNPATSSNDVCPTAGQYDIRLNKMSLQIRTVLKAPLVQVLQEIESYSVASDIAARIDLDSGHTIHYHPYLIPGNDPGGINIAILVQDGVTVNSVTQIWANARTNACSSGTGCLLNDRPPLLLDATYQGYHFRVLAIYDRSLNGLGTNDYVGQKRREEAEQVATIVQALQTTGANVPLDSAGEAGNAQQASDGTITPARNGSPDFSFTGNFPIAGDSTVPVVVVGDFNAYEFSDGYVDVTGTIMGTVDPNPAHSVYPPTGSYVAPSPALFDTGSAQTAANHYSYTFNSLLQEIDHILVTSVGHSDFVSIGNAHGDADVSPAAPDALLGTTPRRTSDHDGQVVTLGWVVTTSANSGGTISATQTVSSAQATTFTVTPSIGYTAAVSDNCNAGSSLGSYDSGTNTYSLPAGVGADCQVSATFTAVSLTVSSSAGANGSVDAPSHSVSYNGSTSFTFTPDAHYHVDTDGDDCGGTATFDVPSGLYSVSGVTHACTVSVTFAIDTFTLTYAAGTNGSITGTSPQTVDYNTSGTAVTAVANPHYHFVKWSDNSTANPRTDSNVTADVNVTAQFAVDTFTLTYTVDAATHGSITGTTPQTVDYNTNGTAVLAVANAGFHFVKWSDNSTANPRADLSVTADISVTADFEADYVPVNPARLMDTRTGQSTIDGGYAGGGKIPAGSTVQLQVANRLGSGIPTGEVLSAVVLNVTPVAPTAAGYMTLWSGDGAVPLAANLNFNKNKTIPNLVISQVNAAGQVSIYNGGLADVDVVVDLQGYFPLNTSYVPMTPARLLDTRSGQSTADGDDAGVGAISSSSSFDLSIDGRLSHAIPDSGVGAVILNVTAVNPTSVGYITAWSGDGAPPLAANLSLNPGYTVPNLVISQLNGSGHMSLYNGGLANTDLVADVQGYFPASSGYTALTPARLVDTRSGQTTVDHQNEGEGAIAASGQIDVTIIDRGGGLLPHSGIGAVVLNVTAIKPTNAGFLTVWPSGTTRPLAANLNLNPNLTLPNLVIAKVGADGKVSIYSGGLAPTDIVVDVQGWFPGDP